MSNLSIQKRITDEQTLEQNYNDTFNAIANKLRESGAIVEIGTGFDGKTQLVQSINGQNVVFKINHERGGDGWHRFTNGKLRVIIRANYETVKQFPQKKDGSFNIEKIVEVILDKCQRLKERKEFEQQQKGELAKSKEQAQLLGAFGITIGHEMLTSDSVVPHIGGVKIHLVQRSMEEARKILEVLHREGLLKSEWPAINW